MSKAAAIKGVMRTFWEQSAEDWRMMDRKLWRIIMGAVMFLVVAYFWLYFFSASRPF